MKKTLKKEEIKKNMTFEELMTKHPQVMNFLSKKGLHCIGCHAAPIETLEQGALAHGINPNKLVKELNLFMSRNLTKTTHSSV